MATLDSEATTTEEEETPTGSAVLLAGMATEELLVKPAGAAEDSLYPPYPY
jgi:hypothetical protein